MNNKATKAVILARGLGTRMRKADGGAALSDEQAAIAQTGAKAMIPIDRPFLDYVMHQLAEAGITKICLVIGPEHDVIRNYYGGEVELTRLTVDFAIQEEPLGTGDAVKPAEEFANGDPFLLLNSDNYYPLDALRGLVELITPGLAVFDKDAMIEGSNIPEDRIKSFAVVEEDGHGFMKSIIEKPDEATLAAMGDSPGVSMNCWRFGPSIFDGCRNITPSARGEYEITDAVQYVIDTKLDPFKVVNVKAPVLDMSSRDDIPAVVKFLKGTEVKL